MATIGFALRMLRRDWRAGELRLLAAALVIAVASVSAVGFFTDRVEQALEREAHQLLGADLLLIADHPWPPAVAADARQIGLSLAETRSFPSMVSAGEGDAARTRLADVKAVSEAYPLRGRLRTATSPVAADAEAAGVPDPGSAWVDERLLADLGLQVGDLVSVGRSRLRVAAVLTLEPDRGVNFFGVAPRLLMNLGDLASTGLVQEGSRVTYRLLVAGDLAAIERFRRGVAARLGRGERIEDAGNARPEIRSVLDRAQRFLGLASLLAVVLAGVGVALATRRYTHRHLDGVAVMRCLGATQARLVGLFLGQFALLGIGAAVVGAGIGFAAHFVLYSALGSLLPTALPAPGPLAGLRGALVGLVLLFGFATPPLLRLRRVPTLRVLRRELGAPEASQLGTYALGLIALAALMFWIAGEVRLGATVAGGFAAAIVVFALAARGALVLLGRFGRSAGGFSWRYGVAGLDRRAGVGVAQIVALALGLTAVLLLTVTRNDLVSAWQRSVPADAPNRFVINIQPDQRQAVTAFLADRGVATSLAPMVRGRLVEVSGRPVSAANYDDEQAKRMVEREFNLSWAAALQSDNRVSAGRWFTPADRGQSVASVEEGLAKRLGLKTGDRLVFEIAGERIALTIIGLRKLSWDSMRVNFFVLTPPAVLESYPASWITAFHLPADRAGVGSELVRAFPNLTVIDVTAILRQVQAVTDQVTGAVQFIFLFTLAAGLVVLYAALAVSHDERRYELSLLRALGAERRRLRGALLAEFATVGGLSGSIAAVGSQAIGWALAEKVFQLDYVPSWWLLPVAATGAAIVVAAAGWIAASRLIESPPLEALRNAE